MMLMESYLRRSDKTAAEELPKLLKLGEVRYGRLGQHRFFLQLFWMTYRKNLKKDNFAPSCRRFLALLDELLETDTKRHSTPSFRPHISEAIVEYYSFIFSHIFEYRAHELIVDLKVYRLLWIHNLTDDAFIALRYSCPQAGTKSASNIATSTSAKAYPLKIWKRYARDARRRASARKNSTDT
jgi:hypothetical protein